MKHWNWDLKHTLRLLGCCRTSMTCLRLSSRSRRLLYSSWLVSSVWCCSLISSQRIFWMVLRCRNSSSCMDSCWRSNIACSRSFWVCLLFSSWITSKWLLVLQITCRRENKLLEEICLARSDQKVHLVQHSPCNSTQPEASKHRNKGLIAHPHHLPVAPCI